MTSREHHAWTVEDTRDLRCSLLPRLFFLKQSCEIRGTKLEFSSLNCGLSLCVSIYRSSSGSPGEFRASALNVTFCYRCGKAFGSANLALDFSQKRSGKLLLNPPF